MAEPPKRAGRSDFERDRARVLHCAGLRRLSAKTQVVAPGSADFPRTRLTHSLECAQIGRELGQEIGCDPDLVDAACLAHDIGHSPFGHNGEAALNELAAPYGGFEGNAQSLRLLTRLEPKVPGAGLNLTRATLDATLKYPWFSPGPGQKFGAYADDAEVFGWIRQGAPDRRACLEAQVMDWADDVAYSVHDMEDGFHAGLITFKTLKSQDERDELTRTTLAYCPAGVTAAELTEVLDDLLALDIWPHSYDGGPAAAAALKNLTSELIGRFCVAAQQATLAAALESTSPAAHPSTLHVHPSPPHAHPATPHARSSASSASPPASSASPPASSTQAPTHPNHISPISPLSHTSPIGHSFTRYAANLVVPRRQRLECALLKGITARYVMTREGVAAAQARERELLTELAHAVERGAPQTLDPLFRPAWDQAFRDGSDAARRRVIIDQVASLTDTSAIAWHHRLCAPNL
ncbi:MAG TPA: deoxyguanosinetriphosphate triphosphohydrolase [Streptosporangiaceae bacterium]|nr:deoxyguanosinetriphosphate triphosphohydrolase [Streptosporangiaceae bacterium]